MFSTFKMKSLMKLNYLCIGHCCHDMAGGNKILGGTVSYSALLAKEWSHNSAIITSVGNDFQFASKFKSLNIPLEIKRTRETTTFENKYIDGKRTQYLLARAAVLTKSDIPEVYKEGYIIHFGSIANEIHPELFTMFHDSFKGLSIQGLLRDWQSDGLVKPKGMDWSLLKNVDIVFLSDEDILGIEDCLNHIIKNCNHVVITHGKNGATIYLNEEKLFFPSFPTQELDPTGAGDTFTTAYLLEYSKSKEARSACIYAHCAASLIIETKGLFNVPTIKKVRDRYEEYLGMFLEL